MLIRIALIACFLAVARLVVVHGAELLFGLDPSEAHSPITLFSASSFSQLLSSYFLVSGMIFGTIVAEYREAGKLLDESVATFCEMQDAETGFLIATGRIEDDNEMPRFGSPALSMAGTDDLDVSDDEGFRREVHRVNSTLSAFDLDQLDEAATMDREGESRVAKSKNSGIDHAQQVSFHADKFLVCWAESLRLPLSHRKSNNGNHRSKLSDGNDNIHHQRAATGPWRKARQHLDACVFHAAHLVRSSNIVDKDDKVAIAAALEFQKKTNTVVDKLRRAAFRIHNIRKTIVLAPAQVFVNIMVVVVCVAVFFMEFHKFPGNRIVTMGVEMMCVACCAGCALLVHGLLAAMDDPFSSEGDRTVTSVSSIVRTLQGAALRAIFFIEQKKGRSHRSRRKRNKKNDDSSEEDDEVDYLDTQISVAPLLRAVRKHVARKV